MLSKHVAALAVAALLTISPVMAEVAPDLPSQPVSTPTPQPAKKTAPRPDREKQALKKKIRDLKRIIKLGFLVRLTSYTAGDPAQGTGLYTALGTLASYGQVAVDKRLIPLGSRLWIPGYGFARATDTGGAIKGAHIDLCFGIGGYGSYALARARAWGTRFGMVYVIPKDLTYIFTS